MDREIAKRLLDRAAAKQAEYWESLTELENELGCEVEGTQDLQGLTIDDLSTEEVDTPPYAVCDACSKALDQADIDGGRCVGCGHMIAAETE